MNKFIQSEWTLGHDHHDLGRRTSLFQIRALARAGVLSVNGRRETARPPEFAQGQSRPLHQIGFARWDDLTGNIARLIHHRPRC